MIISSATELYCIFGNPVKHSLSPLMHNRAFREKNIDAVYLAFELVTIEDGIRSMRNLNIKGASITIPFKISALDCVDEVDQLAMDIGSMNTIVNNNGKLKGYNTDGYGALQAIADRGVNIKNSKILILGNGGSARAISFTLLKGGASVFIAGRNPEKMNSLRDDLSSRYDNTGSILINELTDYFMDSIDVIINTTPLGMAPEIDLSPIRNDLIKKRHVVFDIVYSPDMTKLLSDASQKGCKIIKGIDMLVNQGIRQFELWTGENAPSEIMFKVVSDAIYAKA